MSAGRWIHNQENAQRRPLAVGDLYSPFGDGVVAQYGPDDGVQQLRAVARIDELLLDAGGMHWQRRMEDQLQRRMAFTRLRRLQPVIGEGFVRQPRHLRRLPTGWADLHEMMVVSALTQGVESMTPTFPGLPGL